MRHTSPNPHGAWPPQYVAATATHSAGYRKIYGFGKWLPGKVDSVVYVYCSFNVCDRPTQIPSDLRVRPGIYKLAWALITGREMRNV